MKPVSKLLLATAGALLAMGAVVALALPAPKEPVEIGAEGHRKPAVEFSHSKHFDAVPDLKTNCKRCHHKITGADDPDLKHFVCTDCHGIKANGDIPKIKDAMHKRNVGKCYECHFGSKAMHRLRCNNCHKKD